VVNYAELAEIYHQERRAAARERDARNKAAIAADRERFETILRYFSPEVLTDFEVVHDTRKAEIHETRGGESYLSNAVWRLVPKSLGEDVDDLVIDCTPSDRSRPWGLILRASSVTWQFPTAAQTVWNEQGAALPMEEQRRVLASILVPAVEWIRTTKSQRRATEEQRARQLEAHRRLTERRELWWQRAQALAQRLADEAAASIRAKGEERLSRALMPHLWPEGRELVVYVVEWVSGYDSEGGVHSETLYALDEPEPDRFFRAMDVDGIREVKIAAPNGFKVTRETWRGEYDASRAGLAQDVDTLAWRVDVQIRCSDDSYVGHVNVSRSSKETHCDIPRGGLAKALGLPKITWDERRAIEQTDVETIERELPLGFDPSAVA
jgi:hypothetical protein